MSSKVIRLVTLSKKSKTEESAKFVFLAWFLPAFAGQPAATILSQVKVIKIKAGISKHFTIRNKEKNLPKNHRNLKAKKSEKNPKIGWIFKRF